MSTSSAHADKSPDDLHGILAFLREAERLKTVTRSGWTSAGEPESVAEHTWRLCLLALVLGPRFPEVRLERLLRICIVHDLGEAVLVGGWHGSPVPT